MGFLMLISIIRQTNNNFQTITHQIYYQKQIKVIVTVRVLYHKHVI